MLAWKVWKGPEKRKGPERNFHVRHRPCMCPLTHPWTPRAVSGSHGRPAGRRRRACGWRRRPYGGHGTPSGWQRSWLLAGTGGPLADTRTPLPKMGDPLAATEGPWLAWTLSGWKEGLLLTQKECFRSKRISCLDLVMHNPRPWRGGGMQPHEFFFRNCRRTAGLIALKFCITYGASFAQCLAKKLAG